MIGIVFKGPLHHIPTSAAKSAQSGQNVCFSSVRLPSFMNYMLKGKTAKYKEAVT